MLTALRLSIKSWGIMPALAFASPQSDKNILEFLDQSFHLCTTSISFRVAPILALALYGDGYTMEEPTARVHQGPVLDLGLTVLFEPMRPSLESANTVVIPSLNC